MKTLFISLIAIGFITIATPAVAAESCLTVNGGGKTNQKVCITPAPNPVNQTKPLPQRTANGQVVYPAGNNKNTPNTGPTETSYMILTAMAAAGVFLLRKTNASV